MKSTNKKGVKQLVDILTSQGVRHFIISPGSRNAPVIKALTAHPDTRCHSIVDERSAAYVALGMAKALDEPWACRAPQEQQL